MRYTYANTNPHFVATSKVFYNNTLYKQAADAGIADHIKNYFNTTLKGDTKEEKAESLIRFLEPGAVFAGLSAMGFNKLAFFIPLIQSVFNISIIDIVKDIYNKVKQIINNKKPITEQQAANIVQDAVAKNYTEPSEEQYQEAKKTASLKQNFLNKKISNKDIRTVKLFLKFAEQDFQLKKQADGKKTIEPGLLSKVLSNFNTFKQGKSSFIRLFISLFTTILTIGLASVGFLIVGRTLQETLGVGQDSKKSFFNSEPQTTQTKYQKSTTKEVPTDTWFISIPELSDQKSIGNLIVKFVTDTYPQTKGKENLIKSTVGFSVVLNDILFENRNFLGTHNVYIPSKYPKKSSIADLIIDELSELDKPA